MGFPSGSLGTRKKSLLVAAGILPVRCTGWKPVPPMQLTGYNDWLPIFGFC